MKNKPKTAIGTILETVYKQKDIDSVSLITFDSYELLQDRLDFNDEVKKCFNSALDFRKKYNLPFWDGFNLSLFNNNFSSYEFIEQIKHHNKKAETHKVKIENLEKFFNDWDKDIYLTFNSEVQLKTGHLKHFVLLDFHIPVNDANQKICAAIIRELNLKGYLLISGKSYHFYSVNLVSVRELINILSIALLYSPIIDKAWIAHQLIELSCCLRITPKYNHLPYLVEEII